MTDPRVSIVITTFNRPSQLLVTLYSIYKQRFNDYEIIVVDDGTDERTQGICDAYATRYIKLHRPQSTSYRNQSVPLNVGIRMAKGSLLLIQNAECKHVGAEVIDNLVKAMTPTTVAFAHVTSLTRDGQPDIVYCGLENPRPYFFCGMISRDIMLKLRGFDEDYVGYGYEDDDMANRLTREGLTFTFTNIEVHHQWHEPAGLADVNKNQALYEKKCLELTVRNVGREWGQV